MAGVVCLPPHSVGGLRPQHQQNQQSHRQHLVDFQGRTLCVSTASTDNRTGSCSSSDSSSCTASRVLEAVFSALGVSRSAADSLAVPWRLMCDGRFLAPDQDVPHLSMLRVWTGGLKGGKGGFGAMLRAMAKQARWWCV